uniref:Uncharacterized protein n=1 Tax=Cannabis sativa TaxID=3483 RepID=A0A803NJF3_CANSA
MAAASRAIAERIPLVDLVLKIKDARGDVDSNAKTGDIEDQTKVTSRHKKDQTYKDSILEDPMKEGDESEETNSTEPGDNNQDMPVDDDAEKEDDLDESNPMGVAGDTTTQHLERKIEELTKLTEMISRKQNGIVFDSEEEDMEPCVKRIIDAQLLENFKIPYRELYEGRKNHRDHLSKYNRMMQTAWSRKSSLGSSSPASPWNISSSYTGPLRSTNALVGRPLVVPEPRNPYLLGVVPPTLDGYVATIFGGLYIARSTRNALKRYLNELEPDDTCNLVQSFAQRPRMMNLLVTFIEDDVKYVYSPHNDPLVIET